jgi:hypothetical protein
MPLPQDLEDLLAAAGRAHAAERRRAAADDRREVTTTRRDGRAEAEAETSARTNAAAVWTWATSPEADELRAAMRVHGVEDVRLGSFGILHGERRPGPSFGSCTVYVLAHAPAFFVTIVRGYHGGGSRRVTSAATLAAFMPGRALATLADEMRRGRADDLLREGLAAILGVLGHDEQTGRPR